MAVRVRCPACRSAVMVLNARYRVFLHCHECGEEFMADGGEPESEWERIEEDEPEEAIFEPKQAVRLPPEPKADPTVLMFCPMCGELAAESVRSCPACGEPLPGEQPNPAVELDPHSLATRRFRRRARWLGFLWIWLAYNVASQDIWLGGYDLPLPPMLFAGHLAIPAFPLLATILVLLAIFAWAGQFWAIAVGGLFNYLILFLVVWSVDPMSMGLIAASIAFTHWTLGHPPSTRSR